MQHTHDRKKIVRSLVVTAVVLVVHSWLPLQAQHFLPKEEDIIWKLEQQQGDDFESSHFIDDNRLLFANRDKAEIRSVEDGSVIRTAPSAHQYGFVPNPSRSLFIANNYNQIWLWDIESLSIIDNIVVEDFAPFNIAISESGKYVGAVGSLGESRLAYVIWDMETKERIYETEATYPFGNELAFSGDTLAAISEKGTHLVDLRTKERIFVGPYGTPVFSPDGQWLMIGVPHNNQFNISSRLELVNVQEQKVVKTHVIKELGHLDIQDLSFVSDGTSIYFTHFFTLYSFSIPSLEQQGIFEHASIFDISPNERKLITYNSYLAHFGLVTSIKNEDPSFSLSLSPNPVQEQALLSIPPQGMKHVEIQLLTIEGSIVGHLFSGVVSEPISIPFLLYEYPHLANGQYFMQMIVDGQPQESLPFIIQR